jgi:hypothetical protein
MTNQLWVDHLGGIAIFLAILRLFSFFNLPTLKRLGKFPDPLHLTTRLAARSGAQRSRQHRSLCAAY